MVSLGRFRYLLVGAAAVISVGAPLWSAFVADVDGWLPWALVAAGCVASAVLGLFALSGLLQSDRQSHDIQSLSTAHSQTHVDIQSLSTEQSRTLAQLERLATDPDYERHDAIMRHFGLLQGKSTNDDERNLDCAPASRHDPE